MKHVAVSHHSLDSKTWTSIQSSGTSPPRTYNHSAIVYRNCFYVFGGYGTFEGVESGPGIGHRHSEMFEYSFGKFCRFS